MSHRCTPCHPNRTSNGTGKRVVWILVVAAVAAVAVSVSTRSPVGRRAHPVPPPAPAPMATMSPKKLQAHAADNGVLGGAKAGHEALAARPPADATVQVSTTVKSTEVTRPAVAVDPFGPKPAVKVTRVRSRNLHTTRDAALTDALEVAQGHLAAKLEALDPPVTRVPSVDDLKAAYVKPDAVTEVHPTEADKAALQQAGLDPKQMWVEVDVSLSDDQVRQLRSADRLETAGWFGAAALLVVAALYGFLRADAWTKGYLTTALALLAAGVVGGGVAVLLLMR